MKDRRDGTERGHDSRFPAVVFELLYVAVAAFMAEVEGCCPRQSAQECVQFSFNAERQESTHDRAKM